MNNPEQGIADIDQPTETRKKTAKGVVAGVSAFAVAVGLTWLGIENKQDGQASPVSVMNSKESTTTTSTSTTTTTLPPIDVGAIVRYVAAQEAAEAQRQVQAAIDAQNAAWEAQAAEVNADGKYDRLAQCETGGNWEMTGSRYSGGIGFANSTWNQYRLEGMPYNAGEATKTQQIIVGERVRWEAGEPGTFHDGKWGCATAAGLP